MKRLAFVVLLGLLAIGAVQAAEQYYFNPGTTQNLDYGCVPSCAAQTSSAFGAQTRFVRVVVTNATGYINFAASGATLLVTAATGIFMPRDFPQIFRVPASGRIAVLAHSASGSLWVTELD